MNNQIVPLAFDGHEVRVIDRDGEPLFVLADICKVLELSNPRKVAADLDEDAVTTSDVIDSLGRTQQANVVTEAGLYEVIFKSRKPEARMFKRWVTNEVIPAIRKTGSYGAPKELTFEEMVERTLLESRARIQALESTVQELEPQAAAWDRLASAKGDMSAKEAAKLLARGSYFKGGDVTLYKLLDAKKADGGLEWFFTNGHGQREPYQRVIDQGLIRIKNGSYENGRTGELVATITPRFTQKAIDVLTKHFGAAA